MKISKFLRNFGYLYTWGEGTYLGHNKAPGTKHYTPKLIEKTGDNQNFNEDVVCVSTGPTHCGFITNSGDVYTFGDNKYLQLGHTSDFTLGPMKVQSIPPMKQIECGEFHTIALSESGEVYSWGYASSQNPLKKIFKWRSRNTLGYFSEKNAELPQKIEAIQDHIIEIASGSRHCLALTDEGSIYAWGNNEVGALGHKYFDSHLEIPEKIPFFERQESDKVIKIAAGENSSAALTLSGKVYVWGNNENYEIGVGDEDEFFETVSVNTPTLLKISDLNVVREICLGTNTMMLQSSIGHIYVSGLKIWRYPKKFDVPVELEIQQLCCGSDYFSVLSKEARVIYYGGPFTKSYYSTQMEYPENTEITNPSFFPSTVKLITGKYSYCAAILDKVKEK